MAHFLSGILSKWVNVVADSQQKHIHTHRYRYILASLYFYLQHFNYAPALRGCCMFNFASNCCYHFKTWICSCVCKEHIKCCEFVCRFPRCSHDSSSASCQMQIQIQTAGAEAETNADVDTDTDTNCAPCGQCCLPVCCQACAIIYLLCTHTHTLTVYMSVYVSIYTNSYAYIPFILAYQVEVPFVFIYFVQLIIKLLHGKWVTKVRVLS